jgi:hypothetical protein
LEDGHGDDRAHSLTRFGTESELVGTAIVLPSEASAFIGGAVIRVDSRPPNARHSWPLAAAERTLEFDRVFALSAAPFTVDNQEPEEPKEP